MHRDSWALLALLSCTVPGPDAAEERIRYLRPARGKFVTECEFTIVRGNGGGSITSVTGRGETTLTVTARWGADDRLVCADATLVSGGRRRVARVQVADGKARVHREGQDPQEFEIPPGVIVTSAPDWTDALLLCRRYDRAKGGRQSFAGLWIHPEQPAQRLTFTIERQGGDTLEHESRRMELDRHVIRLRGNSAYVAWADAEGRMIKLAPDGLVLEGLEASTSGLK